MSEQCCENCRFFGKAEPDEDGSDCLRYAPREFRTDGSQTALWPFVFRTEWCGEWQALPFSPEERQRIQEAKEQHEKAQALREFGTKPPFGQLGSAERE